MSSDEGEETRARFRGRAAQIRRNRFLAPVTVTAAVLGPVAAVGGALANLPAVALLSPVLLAGGIAGSLFALSQNPWTTDLPGDFEAGPEGLFESGRLLVPAERMRAGFVVPDPGHGPRVRIQRKKGLPVEIRVRDEAEGRELLRALGLDATQRAATFNTPSRAITDPLWSVILGLGFAALLILFGVLHRSLGLHGGGFQLPLVVAYLGFIFATRTGVTVGADGILRSWMGKKEFWSYGEIESVQSFLDTRVWRKQKWQGIELVLRSGARVRIPVSSKQTLQASNLELILERIREAMESHRQGDAAAETALLARQARTVPDWVQSLRAIGSGAHVDHRTAPVAPERLFRIVEDPSLTASARAGAAVALGGSLDASGKVRLKDAAGATAAPKLRIAIEAAASGDDAALIEALSAIEGEADKRAQV
ncbi:MAG: hypothetical protein ABJE95_18460 [Byssovorax sp.]